MKYLFLAPILLVSCDNIPDCADSDYYLEEYSICVFTGGYESANPEDVERAILVIHEIAAEMIKLDSWYIKDYYRKREMLISFSHKSTNEEREHLVKNRVIDKNREIDGYVLINNITNRSGIFLRPYDHVYNTAIAHEFLHIFDDIMGGWYEHEHTGWYTNEYGSTSLENTMASEICHEFGAIHCSTAVGYEADAVGYKAD